MKICYVISTPEIAGGANRALLDMITPVRKAGHECVVLSPANGSMAEALKECDIEYRVIPFKNSVKFGNTARNIAKYTYNLWEKHVIKRFLVSNGIDLVHNNSFPTLVGMQAAFSANIPYVCHIRENIWSGLGMEFIRDSEAHNAIKNASSNIAISEFIQDAYQKFEPNGKYTVVMDGIRIADYFEEKEIFDNETIKIGIIGVINPQKGQEEAVKAIEILKHKGYDQLHLDIIGKEGNWKGNRSYAFELKKYIKEKNLTNVTFISTIEDVNELRDKRKEYDINLICSRAEGLGRTTIESMLSGSLTIAANAGATSEILRPMEEGLLYECGNPDDLANKIEYAIINRSLMKEIAKRGQSYAVNRFSSEGYAKQIIKLYEDMIRSKR